jgi:hypothetical protein
MQTANYEVNSKNAIQCLSNTHNREFVCTFRQPIHSNKYSAPKFSIYTTNIARNYRLCILLHAVLKRQFRFPFSAVPAVPWADV